MAAKTKNKTDAAAAKPKTATKPAVPAKKAPAASIKVESTKAKAGKTSAKLSATAPANTKAAQGTKKAKEKSSSKPAKVAPPKAVKKSALAEKPVSKETQKTKEPVASTSKKVGIKSAPTTKAPTSVAQTAPATSKKPAVEKFTPAEKSKMKLAKSGIKSPGESKKIAPPPEDAEPIVIDTTPPTNPKIVEQIRGLQNSREQRKDLAQPPTAKQILTRDPKNIEPPPTPEKDRLILMVRDPYWLHACWDVTRKSVERAKAALSGHWHTAKPILRLLKFDDNTTTNNAESVFKDIEIHGGVRNWYIEVEAPATTFRLLLGYQFGNSRFHELARSNPVTMPVPGSSDATDDHWADIAQDADRIYALSGGYEEDTSSGELQEMMQEKLKRPIGTPAMSQFGSGAEGTLRRMKNFHFDLDAEMVVFGSTHPLAFLTIAGEPIKIRSDGSYSIRVPLPNQRQVMAVTSKSRDGLDEQTIVIAVERNTKIMEPLSSVEPDDQ